MKLTITQLYGLKKQSEADIALAEKLLKIYKSSTSLLKRHGMRGIPPRTEYESKIEYLREFIEDIDIKIQHMREERKIKNKK